KQRALTDQRRLILRNNVSDANRHNSRTEKHVETCTIQLDTRRGSQVNYVEHWNLRGPARRRRNTNTTGTMDSEDPVTASARGSSAKGTATGNCAYIALP